MTDQNPEYKATDLDEIVRRIVRVAAPEKIVLFGSTARGTAGPNSDLDLLVIKAGEFHRGELTQEIYLELIGVRNAVDVVVVSTNDVERYGASPYLVIEPALREGLTLYGL